MTVGTAVSSLAAGNVPANRRICALNGAPPCYGGTRPFAMDMAQRPNGLIKRFCCPCDGARHLEPATAGTVLGDIFASIRVWLMSEVTIDGGRPASTLTAFVVCDEDESPSGYLPGAAT
jgi:hypothetical protein